MKKRIKLPTIIGLIILVIGLVTGIVLIRKSQVFKISANVEAIPKNVRISNITNSDISVSWTTDVPSTGFVKYGKSLTAITEVASDEVKDTNSQKSYVHHVNLVSNLNSTIYFKINSNSTEYDNSGIAWQSSLNNQMISGQTSLIASGMVLNVDGLTPSKAIVYLTINGTLISGPTSDEGTFVIPISKYLTNLDENAVVEISVIDGQQQTSQAVIYEKFLKSIPTIILGKTYDFRSLSQNSNDAIPQSSLTIPESVEKSSRFEVVKTETKDQNTSANIESIKDGEIINTTDPEFFGTAPKSSALEIQVESELQTGTVGVGSNGKWKWSPPKDLEPGEHKVTIKWKDASGILRTLTRTFIVQASEGPAFVSTPSATPLITSAPVATATATAISTITPTNSATTLPESTMKPTPETGSLTPTIGLFIMGIGTLLSSVFIYRKQDA